MATETVSSTSASVDATESFDYPKDYRVILHNDNVTTYQFVIFVLETVFNKSNDEAQKITDYIHNHGASIVGTYSFQIAETKAEETMSLAQANGFPLRATIEEV